MYGHAKVTCDARVCGDAEVHGYLFITFDAIVKDNANISEYAHTGEGVTVFGNAILKNGANV
ncbi:MAG: hypothetical protein RR089_08175 [Acidaminococcaceae bacterium]